jgi:LysR family hydrogen peroxide-inducible transcriptional activator
MTITQLEYVVAVAAYKSFVSAAEKCFVTQPTLSMQIQKLEEELGIKLFDRNKHPIAITAMGEAIVAQAQVALYSAHYPEVKLQVKELETDQIIKALRNNEIDAALLSTPLEENGIKEYPLFYEPFVAYFSEGEEALKKRLIKPDDIALERIWLLNEGHCMRNQIINLCSDHIQQLQSERAYNYESSNVETLRKMVDKNKGLTVLPELATVEFGEDQMERVRYFEDPEPVREIGLVTNDHFVRLTLLQSLIDEILELVPEKMRVQKKNRKVLRIQSAKLS